MSSSLYMDASTLKLKVTVWNLTSYSWFNQCAGVTCKVITEIVSLSKYLQTTLYIRQTYSRQEGSPE